MKKFLSLVLALIMTMSLVTISAGATEYKDLTDKDEIQYEEAVAVLNRIGVITGYDDGSFRPETELTRGAAAKIIVSLLIGPEAASNLPNTYAPYPDVPANHTFAGVISYCKTAGIISGYGDGTFKPANSLTGYAFAKMLLGAIGYDSKIQGYTDTGWTMNVARDGNAAGLFNRIEFDGAASVNREQACQLALNTLKATMVEYTGGLSITAGDAHVTANPTITYKTSNQAYARNILNRKVNTVGNVEVNSHYTVEFGEEHFKDLRLNEHGTQNVSVNDTKTTARDAFGRPSNEWSYKKVTIGTFPIEPDFVYTTQVIHKDDEKVSDASKVRALELAPYELKKDASAIGTVDTDLYVNGDPSQTLSKVADIADYTDYGTKVEVYVDEDDADWINTVVVVKTQLMEVKTIKSNAVSLKLYDDGSDASGVKAGDKEASAKGVLYGYNQAPIDEDVNDVEVNDDCYNDLKDMKVGDIVAVIPVWVDSTSKYDVSKVYVPETVSGELTSVDTYGTVNKGLPNVLKATVGGTAYNVALWNKDLYDIDGAKVRVTRKDVTLHLDEYGNAMYASGVGSTSDYIIIGGYHSGLVDGKVVTFVDGWDIKGNELSLNIGNINYSTSSNGAQLVTPTGETFPIGNLARYTNAVDRYAEWQLDYKGVYPVASERNGDADTNDLPTVVADRYNLKASNGRVLLNDYNDITAGAAAGAINQSDKQKANDEDVMVDGVNTSTYDNKTQTRNVDVDDAGIKVIYVTKDTDSNEVDSIEIKSGMQAISSDEIRGTDVEFKYPRAQACVNLKDNNTTVKSDSVVKAIVIKKESGSANLSDLVYVSSYIGSINKAVGTDASSKPVYGYQVHFLGQDNWDDEVTIYTTTNLRIGDFAKARKDANVPSITGVTEDNYYRTTRYGGNDGIEIHKALSVLPDAQIQKIFGNNKTLLKLMNYNNAENDINNILPGATVPPTTNSPNLANIAGVFTSDVDLDLGGEAANNIVSIRKAKIIDLTKNGIDSASDLKDLWDDIKDRKTNEHPLINISLVFNDKWDDDSFRTVYAMIITEVRGDDEGGYIIPGSDADPKTYAAATWTAGNAVKDTDFTVTGPTEGVYTVTPASGKTITLVDGTGYTVKENADKTWTVTVTASTGTVNVEVNDASIKVEKALTVVLDADSAAAKAGVTIAGVHVVTTEEDGAGPYKGEGVGTAVISLSVPAGVSVAADTVVDAKLTWTDGGFSYEKAAESIGAGDTTIIVKPASGTKFDSSLTYTLTGLKVAVSHKVTVESDVTGLTFATTTDTADETTGGDLKLAIKGVPAYATKVDVYFTVEGLAAGTLKGTKDAATGYQKLNMTANKGAISEAAIADDGTVKADPKADNVVITIKDMKVTEQNAEIKGATPTTLTVKTGEAFGLPELTVALGAQVSKADAIVSIDGVTTDDSTNFPTTGRKMTLTAGKTTDESTSGKKYTSDGKSAVVITVTPAVTELKADTFSSLTDDITVAIKNGGAIKVKDGVNEEDITITVTGTNNLGQNKILEVTVKAGATGASVFKSEKINTTADGKTGDVVIGAGLLSGFDGGKVYVTVDIKNATT